ncbi:MAG: SLBB domain-containing protein, partial [Candidatus Margulisbacteria bacterium]|nr:SLBB domain-containing protein [Candidatus Margulisiibacteriota bacterium]
MKFRCLVAYLILSCFCFESAFAAVSPADYQTFLNTPQGRDMLKNAKPGQEVSIGKNEAKLQEQPEAGQPEELTDIEKQFSKVASLEGLSQIKLFGYDAFKRTAASFIPDLDSQVPADYIVGPGDSFKVTLWGISEGIFDVTVNQAGEIVLPKVGVVSVVGVRYGGLQDYITKQLNRYYEQINVNVTLSKIKTIRVYVVGEVNQPGSYTVSSLSTLYSALFQAGGPSKQGSLRNIKLLRDGRTIATIDLYKFLIYGDKSQDRVLDSGDTIFVPTRGDVVAITGNVKRPAIYEIKGRADLSELLQLAGGFTSLSYLNRIQIDRVVAHQKRIILDRNFSSDTERANFSVQDMDLVKVYPILDDVQNVVFAQGNFKYVGPYEWKSGMKLKDIISSKDVLKPFSYLPKAEVVRMDLKTFDSLIYSIDLEKFFSGDESQNMTLRPGDKIFISTDYKPQASVLLKGEFKLPGTYVIGEDECLSSVIKRAGGFTEDAYLFGSVFIRKSAANLQENALTRLINDMEKKIVEQETAALI